MYANWEPKNGIEKTKTSQISKAFVPVNE